MNMKQLLIPVALTVIFSLNANASLVELEFSNGTTVSFDDTISREYTSYPGDTLEFVSRNYNTEKFFVSHPDNVMNDATFWNLYSREAIGDIQSDYFTAHSAIDPPGNSFQSNQVYTTTSYDFNLITSDIVSSLVDMAGVDDLFRFHGVKIRSDNVVEYNIFEDIILTNVSVDGVSQTSPVPVPGAVWLFGSAIMGLIARRKLWNKNGAL